ncbi:rab-GTPase-TBC domain-containing protein [Lentinula boryana]|uniref:Rab-GTPase-TBC domain-containing protein n=1 Tax=Lentinula boryana TaxID=40481 RepID=A0ABQ8PZ01_9AGAR|nr:rab-GTPase-TBC domain-containing protein [Lentinula boryana]
MDYAKTFWKEARQKSLEPGGFGENRVLYWSKLLNINVNDHVDTEIDIETLPAHPDEQQIRLDTDRSFVMYPDGDVQGHQESLNELLVSLFRRHPSLSYFQGYHDIITVLFLTLPPSLRYPCAEKVSLHWTRDAMGDGLEPVLGLLRFLAKLIAAIDSELAKLLRRVAPLPYFALSNLLTMFAHNVPTLPLIQHIFDYLLARPPIAIVYLTAAVILAKKDELLALDEEDGDLGMLHSLLGALPQISDDPTSEEVVTECKEGQPAEVIEVEINRQSSSDSSLSIPDVRADTEKSSSNTVVTDETDTDTIAESESSQDTETVLDSDIDSEPSKPLDPVSPLDSSPVLSLPDSLPLTPPLTFESNMQPQSSHPPSRSPSPMLSASQSSIHSTSLSSSNATLPARDPLPSSSSSQSQPQLDGLKLFRGAKRSPIPLSTLLRDADKLLEAYPPHQDYSNKMTNVSSSFSNSSGIIASPPSPSYTNLPDTSLASVLASIMGPYTIVYTWSEDPAKLPSDTEAESMVRDTSKVVFPWDPSLDEDGEVEVEQDEKDSIGNPQKRRRGFGDGRVLRPELMLSAGAGAVLVIAIALAMFSNRGARGERVPLDRLLGFLGIWGAWGWNWIGR